MRQGTMIEDRDIENIEEISQNKNKSRRQYYIHFKSNLISENARTLAYFASSVAGSTLAL